MANRSYEGVLVVLVPQRGSELVDLLREAVRGFLGDGDPRPWAIELGVLQTPAGALAFRPSSASELFPWRDGGGSELARIVSNLGPGRCWALALEKPKGAEGWAEGVVYDRGERLASEESTTGPDELLAWFGEQLALSENQVLALFESCDQSVGLQSGEQCFEDEIDQLLAKARREYQRYRALKDARERGQAH